MSDENSGGLRGTIRYINDGLSETAQATRTTIDGQPVGAYALVGFTIAVIGVMIFRNKGTEEEATAEAAAEPVQESEDNKPEEPYTESSEENPEMSEKREENSEERPETSEERPETPEEKPEEKPLETSEMVESNESTKEQQKTDENLKKEEESKLGGKRKSNKKSKQKKNKSKSKK